METSKNGRQSKNEKIPRGYRLKIATHNKIKELQEMTSGSQDKVISRAIRLYSKELTNKIKKYAGTSKMRKLKSIVVLIIIITVQTAFCQVKNDSLYNKKMRDSLMNVYRNRTQK
jgi:hypothetical protein